MSKYHGAGHQIVSERNPGWSPRANQRWTALFQRFHKFQPWSALFQRFHKIQRWSALFQNGLRKLALISTVSELFSAGFLWISAVQRWIKTKWETDENASCKFEKVLGSRKTCSFGVYQLWKKSFRRNSSQKFELTHPPLPHASWSHVTCRIEKRLKYRVLIKKWTENKAKVVLISVFLLFQTKMWRILTSAVSEENSPEQLCFRKSALKQLWFSADFFALKIWCFNAVSEKISSEKEKTISEKISAETALNQLCFRAEQRCFSADF